MHCLFAWPLAAIVFAAAAPSLAQEAGDIARGAQIAARECADCHVVRDDQLPSFYSLAPSFMSIAARRGMSERTVRVLLVTPHSTMPNIVLSSDERVAIAAYIMSLK